MIGPTDRGVGCCGLKGGGGFKTSLVCKTRLLCHLSFLLLMHKNTVRLICISVFRVNGCSPYGKTFSLCLYANYKSNMAKNWRVNMESVAGVK